MTTSDNEGKMKQEYYSKIKRTKVNGKYKYTLNLGREKGQRWRRDSKEELYKIIEQIPEVVDESACRNWTIKQLIGLDEKKKNKDNLTFFEELHDLYFVHKTMSKKRFEYYKSVLKKFQNLTIDNKKVGSLKVINITPFLLQNKICKAFSKDCSKKTFKDRLSILRKLFAHASSVCNIISYNPISNLVNLHKFGYETNKRKGVEERIQLDVIQKIINALPDGKKQTTINKVRKWEDRNDWQLIASIAAFTGMRQGELRSLKWEDINFEVGQINITHSVTDDRIDSENTKAGRIKKQSLTRKVELNIELIKRLKEFKIRKGSPRKTNYIFQNQTGKMLGWKPFQTRMEEASKKVFGIDEEGNPKNFFHWHEFRHFFASDQLTRLPLEDVSEMLGHHSIKTTEDVYKHFIDNKETSDRRKKSMENISIRIGHQ